VPRYLTFREARIEVPKLAADEIEARRAASVRATERIAALLATLKLAPSLREAVQASLGSQGRARFEDGILLSFKSIPDTEQRARVLALWNELEAAAVEKR